MGNILNIAQTALSAAQAGLATTGHNIANAATPGYSRQVVLQAAVAGQSEGGGGFIGKGTAVVGVQRIYSEYLSGQVSTAQTSMGQLSSHYTEISRINNLLADPSSGLSPVLQDFFKSVQDVAANKGAGPSRYAMLAAGESLSARFQSMDGQLRDIRNSVNSQVITSVGTINSYAKQIANLNEAISKAQNAANGHPPNDMLDQRDHIVAELSKETKVTVVKEGSAYSVFIGNGQPMVVGLTANQLKAIPSATDLSEMTVGFVSSKGTIALSEASLQGGKLGGLLEFRSKTLNEAQNMLGRIALGIAETFNEQHSLGLDQNGIRGDNFFRAARPVTLASQLNTSNAQLNATIVDMGKVTTSDYKVAFDGTNYTVTRLSDNVAVYPPNAAPPVSPVEIDGLNFSVSSGPMAAGDYFIVKPTVNGAAEFDVLLTDKAKIATATPVTTSVPTTNSGSGTITAGSVDSSFFTAGMTLPLTIDYDSATNTLNGFPAGQPVTVNGTALPAPWTPGAPVPFNAGDTITVGGVSFSIAGKPADNDEFVISNNANPAGDNRNTLLLGSLQTRNTLEVDSNGNPTATYQGAFGQLVSLIGNKTHELQVTSTAEGKLLASVKAAQQSESGVNLDEEATNLLRYQQAYQAAGKVMQTVNEMFNVLISLGRN